MTIDEMTNEQLNIAVATEVMGWKKKWEDELGSCWNTGKENVLIGGMGGGEWSPSTNIAHAWEVVEKLSDKEARLTTLFKSYVNEGYFARFGEGQMNTYGDTAPLAICHAALSAVRGMK